MLNISVNIYKKRSKVAGVDEWKGPVTAKERVIIDLNYNIDFVQVPGVP